MIASVDLIIIAITIDNFAVASHEQLLYKSFIELLRRNYDVKETGPISQLIGWSIFRDTARGLLHNSQPRLAQDFINIMRLGNANLADSP